MKSSSSPSWQVDLQCPQCGALVVMEETDRIFSCAFCRVRLYLYQENPFRYYLPPREKPLDTILFAPYWRFKGMVFNLEKEGITERFVDSSLLALRSQSFPASLGLRPQALRLKHLTPGLGGKYLAPTLPFRGYPLPLESAPGAFRRPPSTRPDSAKAFIGEMTNLIYAPFRVNQGVLFDAILDSPLTQFPDDPADDLPLAEDPPGSIHFLPMLCPTCGWDLEGEQNALVLLCRNCESAWQAVSNDGMDKVAFAFAPSDDGGSHYLPFWQIQASIPGTGLRSFADLARFANLPRASLSHWEELPLVFWIPAFKTQPSLFLRLARIFTLAQPAHDNQSAIPRSPLHQVTLPLAEALESIRVLMAAVAVKREGLPARLTEVALDSKEASLVYFPFTPKGTELIQPTLQTSINANALTWGRSL